MWTLTNRRLTILLLATLATLIFWRHILILSRILPVYAFWGSISSPNALSISRDAFDTSFARYPIRQWSARWPPTRLPKPSEWEKNDEAPTVFEDDERWMELMDGKAAPLVGSEEYAKAPYSNDEDDVVPPVLHHILLGMERTRMPASWEASRQTCLQMHPKSANYTHLFWDDESALKFMSSEYPWFLRHWLSYTHPIQRADSLRYFVLHHYGGIFLDLDLECLRSLGPLRRFPVVNIAAFPAGVSNGFMMAAPKHPFLAQLVGSLRRYDRSFFGIPYIDVMLSTGPMFLSAEHLRYPFRTRNRELRILASHSHRLNGRTTTPLFRHLGASSWHEGDALLLRRLRLVVLNPILLVSTAFVAGLCAFFLVKRCCGKQSKRVFGVEDRRSFDVDADGESSDGWGRSPPAPSLLFSIPLFAAWRSPRRRGSRGEYELDSEELELALRAVGGRRSRDEEDAETLVGSPGEELKSLLGRESGESF